MHLFQMINNFERDMSDALDALRQEKENAAHEIELLNEKVGAKDD